jgi:hypothetical protein
LSEYECEYISTVEIDEEEVDVKFNLEYCVTGEYQKGDYWTPPVFPDVEVYNVTCLEINKNEVFSEDHAGQAVSYLKRVRENEMLEFCYEDYGRPE